MELIKIGGHKINDTLTKDSIVIDVGAHEGKFAQAIVKKYGCKVDAYEPSKKLYKNLAKRAETMPGSIFVNAAIGVNRGEGKFTDYGNEGQSGSMLNRSGKMYKKGKSHEVMVMALWEAISRHAKVSLLKLNCEGAEVALLLGTPAPALRMCAQIKVSFHTGAAKGFDPPFTKAHVDKCNARMKRIGFTVEKVGSKNPDFVYMRK